MSCSDEICMGVCARATRRDSPRPTADLRDGAMAVGVDGLHEPRGRHLPAEVVVCVCGKPAVAVDERHEGQGFRQVRELQVLRRGETTSMRNPHLPPAIPSSPCNNYTSPPLD